MHKSLVFGFGVLLLMALVVMHVKYYVASVQRNVVAQERRCKKLSKRKQVLEIEWAFLRTPERLKRLSEKLLNLSPLSPEQLLCERQTR